MNLTPREKDKLMIAMAAIVARKRLEPEDMVEMLEGIGPLAISVSGTRRSS